jgi:hypothetical protein
MNNDTLVLEQSETNQAEVVELNELQLALVGGGAGETILH